MTSHMLMSAVSPELKLLLAVIVFGAMALGVMGLTLFNRQLAASRSVFVVAAILGLAAMGLSVSALIDQSNINEGKSEVSVNPK